MWLAKKLNPGENAAPVGGLFALEGEQPVLETGEPLSLGGVLTPYGYYGAPPVCTEAAALPLDGEYLLLGEVARTIRPAAGEVLIRSQSGGYIHLLANGEILLNGLRITADGQIITPQSEEE